MIRRYCDMCDQQIDEGVHSWYVIELHGTDGEFRRKELCEECFASEINCLARPNRCETCSHWWKSEEVCLLDDCHYKSETEPQEWWLTENSLDDFRSGFIHGYAQAKHEYEPKNEPQTLKGGEDVHEFCKKCGESKARTIDGERYIVCEKASDMACVSMKGCPLGKWVCEETYIVMP